LLNIDAPRDKDELLALYELGKDASGDGSIVEIGSFRGSSTVALAMGSRKGAGKRPRIYSIDPYEHFTGELGRAFGPMDRVRLLKNLLYAGVAQDVWLIHLPSQAASRAWSGPISLLWIDGDHSYEGTHADLEFWSPFVIPDGVIAFDDSLDPDVGPCRVIAEALESARFERVAVHGKITVLRPVAALGPAAGMARARHGAHSL
jgi:predicted O-methyltransferase YrrM